MENNSSQSFDERLLGPGLLLKMDGKSDNEVYQMYRLKGLSENDSRVLTQAVIARYAELNKKMEYVNLPFNWSAKAVGAFCVAGLALVFFLFLIDPITYYRHPFMYTIFASLLVYGGLLMGTVFLRTPPDYDPYEETRNLGRYRHVFILIIPALVFMLVMAVSNNNRAEAVIQKESVITVGQIISGESRTTEHRSIRRSYTTTDNKIKVEFNDAEEKLRSMTMKISSARFSMAYEGEPVVIAYFAELPEESVILDNKADLEKYTGPRTSSFDDMGEDILNGEFSQEKQMREQMERMQEMMRERGAESGNSEGGASDDTQQGTGQ